MALRGTGSAGMETCVVNLIEPGDRMVACINGVFGGRMAEVAERLGAEVTRIERPFGEVFSPEEIREVVQRVRPKAFGIVHAETSTGAWQPLEEIAGIVHDAGSLLIVDCVTSLAGVPVEVDRLGIDAAYSGSQKCLSCPPGLAPSLLARGHSKPWIAGLAASPAGISMSDCSEITGGPTALTTTPLPSI